MGSIFLFFNYLSIIVYEKFILLYFVHHPVLRIPAAMPEIVIIKASSSS